MAHGIEFLVSIRTLHIPLFLLKWILYGKFQRCTPRDRDLGLETARDQNFAVLFLALGLGLGGSVSAVYDTDQ